MRLSALCNYQRYLCSLGVLILKLSSVSSVISTSYGCSSALTMSVIDLRGICIFFFLCCSYSNQSVFLVMTRMHLVLRLLLCRQTLVE